MSILGIGSWEFLLILVFVIVILGPERSRDAGMALGRLLRRVISSEFWRELLQIARFMQRLPQNLIKMAELEEMQAQLAQDVASMQREIRQATEPVQALASGRAFQDPLREVQAEVKKAVSGATEPENRIDPRPQTTPAPPPEAAAARAPEPKAPRPTVPPPGPARDDEMVKLVKDLGRYAEEWPAVLDRLAAMEKAQAELAEQVRDLRQTAGVVTASPVEEAE